MDVGVDETDEFLNDGYHAVVGQPEGFRSAKGEKVSKTCNNQEFLQIINDKNIYSETQFSFKTSTIDGHQVPFRVQLIDMKTLTITGN